MGDDDARCVAEFVRALREITGLAPGAERQALVRLLSESNALLRIVISTDLRTQIEERSCHRK